MSSLLRLHPSDNVLTAVRHLAPGETISIDDSPCTLPAAIPFAHKLAAREILAGEKIVKYGAPIGSATRAIARGEHVHTHNLQSDYLPGGELSAG